MRPFILAMLSLAACSDADRFTPTVSGLGTVNGTPIALPLQLCDAPELAKNQWSGKLEPVPVSFTVLGSGFMPEVANITGSEQLTGPSTEMVGPTVYNLYGTVQGGTRLLMDAPYAESPVLTDGVYSIVVRNPDPSETATATLAGAVNVVPRPVATSTTPDPVCLSSSASVVFHGGPFVQGQAVLTDAGPVPPGDVHVDSPNQLTATLPAGATQVTFGDPSGCSSTYALSLRCP